MPECVTNRYSLNGVNYSINLNIFSGKTIISYLRTVSGFGLLIKIYPSQEYAFFQLFTY